jgi:hypothetical protein
MIIGAHAIIYSRNPDADRAFLRDRLDLSHVDIGEGWLIFALPPTELAVHPSEQNDHHELYLMCADIHTFVTDMKKQGVSCSPIQSLDWGKRTQIKLPGGGHLGIYQPLHRRPELAHIPTNRRSSHRTSRKAA